ncbi:hypothetical protein B0F90DRAFT_1669635 [Multifurca ochricompacta]|uniref:SHSP domain-containing protein n=1 Tax=Multifurca ochricompacta TaxID=376703 RepID=A0AAD4M0I9_9AGAM|nr:hypothetical protein B0F90DRAFT_1669635 [Multifurca ochricompacta]
MFGLSRRQGEHRYRDLQAPWPTERGRVVIRNDILIVPGESEYSTERSEEGYTLRERRYGKFLRSTDFVLKNEDIKTSMDHGILTVHFPDASHATITIDSSMIIGTLSVEAGAGEV